MSTPDDQALAFLAKSSARHQEFDEGKPRTAMPALHGSGRVDITQLLIKIAHSNDNTGIID